MFVWDDVMGVPEITVEAYFLLLGYNEGLQRTNVHACPQFTTKISLKDRSSACIATAPIATAASEEVLVVISF